MNTYYYDCGWRGGVVVMAENEEEAWKILEEGKSIHYDRKKKLIELLPGTFYDFYGDS